MARQIEGQMTLDDYFSLGAQLRREGYTNSWDKEKPECDSIVDVIDHEGYRFRTALFVNTFGNWVFDASKGRGYDICWWKVVRPFNDKDKEKYDGELYTDTIGRHKQADGWHRGYS